MDKVGLHIAFEGIDGSGGTTQCKLLKKFLESKNLKVYTTQEPSSSDIGILLRKYLKDSTIHPSTDALLFAADRSNHYFNEIKEKLEQNYIVISDRYLESSIAYQAAQTDEISIEWINTINKFIEKPHITIILDIPPETSLARKDDQELEKFEESGFLERVRKIYLKRAKIGNYFVINSEISIEEVHERVQKVVMDHITSTIEQFKKSN